MRASSTAAPAVALVALAALCVLALACNVITGADAFGVHPTDDNPITSSSSGASSASSTSSSSGTSGTTSSGSTSGGVIDEHDRSTDASSDAPTSSMTDASFDAATNTPPSFTDNFERPNNAAVGNGWLEKLADKYAISGGGVLQSGLGTYTDNIVYRPETSLNAQVSLDVVYGSNFDTDPSMHLRMQPTSATLGSLDSYSFYAYRDFAAISREDPGDNGMELTSVTLSPMLEIGKAYRMTFRVTGTDPVKVEASITTVDGAPITALSANDASSMRITTAGKVGFGAGKAEGTRWDNFVRTDL